MASSSSVVATAGIKVDFARRLRWAKDRALVYLKQGNKREAAMSFVSDMKHYYPEDSIFRGLMMMAMGNPEKIVDEAFIEGFNCMFMYTGCLSLSAFLTRADV